MKKRLFSLFTTLIMICSFVGIVPKMEVEAKSITVYSQTDSRWGSHYYGYSNTACTQRATINSGGCGILSYVNAVYYLNGSFIEPTTLADWSVNNGYRVNGVGTAYGLYSAFANAYGEKYSIAYNGSSTSYTTLKNHLENGEVAIGSAPGHLMAIVDYDSSTGKFLILDSYRSSDRYTYPSGYTWQTESTCRNTNKLNFSGFYFIKSTKKIETPVDLGTNFYAYIINTSLWKHITNDSFNVSLRSETGAANQIWKFEIQSDNSYKIINCFDKKVLDVANFGTIDGTNVQVCESNDSTAQRWFVYGEAGAYVLKAKCGDLVLDINGGLGDEGTNVQMWTSNDTSAQKFQIYQLNQAGKSKITATAGTSYTNTKLNWTKSSDTNKYVVKIWKNKAWEGNAYKEFATTETSWNVILPEGTYQAYVDSCNNYSYTCSNVVTFTVKKGTCTHSYGSWTTTKSATCTVEGTKTRKCSICGATETGTIAKTAHKYTSKVIAPTCTAKGYTEYVCSACKHTYKDKYTEMTAHKYGDWTVAKKATCTEDGSKTRKCACGKTETATIAKIGHTYTSKVVAPTCTAKGYTLHTCSACGNSYKDAETVAKGHKFTSISEKGSITYTCSSCKLSYEVTFEGEGTVESPYLIANKEDLFCLAKLVNNPQTTGLFRTKCYKQTANIDLDNEQWVPLGTYIVNNKSGNCYIDKGFVYDGANHSVFNLNVNESSSYSGFIGKMNYGTVKNLAIYGEVKSTGSLVGGIVGELGYMGTIENCSFNGNVSGKDLVGGIVGHCWRGSNILNCYHNGNIASEKNAGGIAGFIQHKDSETELHSNISNCYHIGDISGTTVGGVVGKYSQSGTLNENNSVNIKNCYFHKTSSENAVGEGTVTKNDSMPLISGLLKEAAPDLGKGFSTNSYEAINDGYPVFEWQLPSKVKGDVNNDGAIKVADIVMIQKYLTKSHTLSSAECITSDMNEDGNINVFDMIMLKRTVLDN